VTRTFGSFPYGETWYETGTIDKWKFTSYERDTAAGETGLDYADFRYYASGQGRFINVDPLAGELHDFESLNRYSYVLSDPVGLEDPLGLHSGMCLDTRPGPGHGNPVSCSQLHLSLLDQTNFNWMMFALGFGGGGSGFGPFGGGGGGGGGPRRQPNKSGCLAPGEAGPPTLECLNDPCTNSTLSAAGVTAEQQIGTAQGFIIAGEIGGSGPYGNEVTRFLGGMFGYYEAVRTGGPNDIKNQPGPGYHNNIGVAAGNISFGVTCPYGGSFCQFAAGLAQTLSGDPDFNGTIATGFDSPKDNAAIQIGQAMRAGGCHE
jgi:RHS repeat-associated protein